MIKQRGSENGRSFGRNKNIADRSIQSKCATYGDFVKNSSLVIVRLKLSSSQQQTTLATEVNPIIIRL